MNLPNGEDIKKLRDAGVFSFKIEGRLKDSFYIRNTVLHYRKLLDKIHKNEKCIDCLDYLKYSLEKDKGEEKWIIKFY